MMKTFRIDVFDSNPMLMTEQLVKDHVDFLKDLHEKGRLMFCGPCFEDGTAMLLIKAESKQNADDIIANDPFSIVRFYRQRTIKEIAECNIDNQFLLQASIDFIRSKEST